MRILNVVKMPLSKAWTSLVNWVMKAATWQCGCIFTKECADVRASRNVSFLQNSALLPSLQGTAKYCTSSFIQIPGIGLSTKWRVCGNGCCLCKDVVVTSWVVSMCFNRYILFIVNYLNDFKLIEVVLWEDVSLCQDNLFAWVRKRLKDFRQMSSHKGFLTNQ